MEKNFRKDTQGGDRPKETFFVIYDNATTMGIFSLMLHEFVNN
jgi:hypothetical protein